MYSPRDFQVPLPLAKAFLARYDFGTLLSVEAGVPVASHLPFLYRPDEGPFGTLTAHMAKANPQWTSFTGRSEVTAIFQGPHAYVSPAWYGVHPSVPTWNYVVVHARGIARTVTESPRVRAILAELVEKHDETWTLDVPEAYLEGMVRQIVAFDIELVSLEGKFKLSQNRPDADQVRVQQELARSPDPLARELAGLMLALREGRGLGGAPSGPPAPPSPGAPAHP